MPGKREEFINMEEIAFKRPELEDREIISSYFAKRRAEAVSVRLQCISLVTAVSCEICDRRGRTCIYG